MCSGEAHQATEECDISVAVVYLKVFQPTKTDGANIAIGQPLLSLDDRYADTVSPSTFLHI